VASEEACAAASASIAAARSADFLKAQRMTPPLVLGKTLADSRHISSGLVEQTAYHFTKSGI
jgi:hypothetical protein